MPRAKFLTVNVELSSKEEILTAIEMGEKVRIATLNPEFMLTARTNPAFRTALSHMTHCTIDGTGLAIFLRLWKMFSNIHVPAMYHGADLTADLFRQYQNGEKRFFLIGGAPGLADQTAEVLRRTYPKLQIVGSTDGGKVDTKDINIPQSIREQITTAHPDILLVGFGAPKQELWIDASHLDVPVMIGIGGTFGFYTTKKRAPKIIRNLHMEWLYRVFTETGHWRRGVQAFVVFPLYALTWLLKSVLLGKVRA